MWKAPPPRAKISPQLRTRYPTLLDLDLLDVLGKPLAVKGRSAKHFGVMKRNLLKKPSGLVVGAYPERTPAVTQSLTAPSLSVRENPGGNGNGPVSPPIVTHLPKLTRSPALLRSWGWNKEQGYSGYSGYAVMLIPSYERVAINNALPRMSAVRRKT